MFMSMLFVLFLCCVFKSFLIMCACRGDLDSIKVLVENGVDCCIGDYDNRTVSDLFKCSKIDKFSYEMWFSGPSAGNASSSIKWKDQCVGLSIESGRNFWYKHVIWEKNSAHQILICFIYVAIWSFGYSACVHLQGVEVNPVDRMGGTPAEVCQIKN